MGAPDDFPDTVNVKGTLSRLEDEHSRQYCLDFRREIFSPSENNFAQMPLTVVCEQKVKCIDWIRPEPGELRVLGNVRTEEAKELYTETVIKHFKDNYETRADELGKFQDLCQHVGVRKGQTVDDCKAQLQELGQRGVFINIYDFLDARKAEAKVYRFPAIEPLRYYSFITDRVFPRKLAETWRPRLGERGIRRHLAAKGKPREIPDSLTFMLVNLCRARAGVMYDKALESPQVRAQNVMNSFSDLDGKTPEPTTEVRGEAPPQTPSLVSDCSGTDVTSDCGISDDTSRPTTPGDEDMGEITNRMKTLGIPNGV